MNTEQINDILFNHRDTRDIFAGTFAIDLLPSTLSKPYAVVMNLDKNSDPGSHWTCIFADHDGTHYHDSFGILPLKKEIYRLLGEDDYTYTSVQLQSIRSYACGQHCVAYLLKKGQRVDTLEYLEAFGLNKRENDRLVTDYVRKQAATL